MSENHPRQPLRELVRVWTLSGSLLIRVLHVTIMIILEDTESGCIFIDESTGDYFCAIYNYDCKDSTDVYPLELGPAQDLSEFDEIPF